MNSLDEKLEAILNRFTDPKGLERLDLYYKRAVETKTLLTRYDILEVFGISLNTWNELTEALRKPETTEKQMNQITYIRDKIDNYEKNIKIINDKSIKSGAKISKSTMSYLLKEKEEEISEMVIINVNIKGNDPITLDRLMKKNDK